MEHSNDSTGTIGGPSPRDLSRDAHGTLLPGAAFPVTPPIQRHVTAWSIPWALAPLFTFGVLTPVTIAHAAARLRSRTLALSALLYFSTLVFIVVAADAYHSKPPSGIDALMTLGLLGTWLGGTIQAVILRRRTFARHPEDIANRAAEQAALRGRELRARSRKICRRDPRLARELRIGRPDLPRAYDDGGLVDVNHAPAEVLTAIPGITSQTAEQMIRHREQRGPYVSAEDVAVTLQLDPTLVPQMAEYTVFLP